MPQLAEEIRRRSWWLTLIVDLNSALKLIGNYAQAMGLSWVRASLDQFMTMLLQKSSSQLWRRNSFPEHDSRQEKTQLLLSLNTFNYSTIASESTITWLPKHRGAWGESGLTLSRKTGLHQLQQIPLCANETWDTHQFVFKLMRVTRGFLHVSSKRYCNFFF
jgi:hypothetical protein